MIAQINKPQDGPLPAPSPLDILTQITAAREEFVGLLDLTHQGLSKENAVMVTMGLAKACHHIDSANKRAAKIHDLRRGTEIRQDLFVQTVRASAFQMNVIGRMEQGQITDRNFTSWFMGEIDTLSRNLLSISSIILGEL